jgi:recombination DNA repair RAD52 pathway protein
MGFSTKQVQALRRQLDRRHVRTREANGREISYVEGWYAISEANRIFGFDGWNRETVESRCDLSIDALEIAKGLWEHTRPKAVPSDTHVSGAGTDLIRQN